MVNQFSRLISVAPMMDWTDRHCRYFFRLIAPNILLYSEMIITHAIIHGDKDYLLRFHPAEYPLALQLGGNDPHALAECARIGESYGYDEINLNVGCPSPRVSHGEFGACLMQKPALVASCVSAMQERVNIPVTVKCRIGVDSEDSYEHLHQFIETVSKSGCDTFIVHARKALLKGLSPKQNRDIPPLQYHQVVRLKQDFPHLNIVINGGIKTLSEVEEHLQSVDGVMIGREAYANPYFLAELQSAYYPHQKILSRIDIIENMYAYIDDELNHGTKLSHITRHILGLFQGITGAAAFRRHLSQHACTKGAGLPVLQQAVKFLKIA
jgi:tRNA-dihydrouridine synthase A